MEIGDNFAINDEEGNSEGQDFWLICYTKSLHTIKKAFKCKCGIKFEEGDEVVARKYYQKWGDFDSSYILLKYSHVYMYGH